jgi:CRP-like cAMP-binding protein
MESEPVGNRLLAALPAGDRRRWLAQLERVELRLGQVLYESGDTLSHVYFPTTAIVSLLYVMESGASAEIAIVGNEGVVGISLFMGGESTTSRAVVQGAGFAYRLPSKTIKEALAAALYPGIDHPDVADRGMQPASLARSATLPLAAAEPRSHAGR